MPDEFAAIPKALQDEINHFLNSPRYKFHFITGEHDSPCIWLDEATGKCKHYEIRPDVCREFEVGNISCRMLRKEVGLTVNGMPTPVE